MPLQCSLDRARCWLHVERQGLDVVFDSFQGRRVPGWKLSCVALCALLAGACNGIDTEGPGPIGPVGPVGDTESGIAGSGNRTTESREVPDFDKLVFFSEGEVILTQAATASLSIEADDNLHEYLTTGVSDGELTIVTADDTDIAPSESIVFRVGMVDLTRIELAGVGAITAENLDASELEVTLSGTGDISIDGLRADEVVVDLGGVGAIRLQGEAGRQQQIAPTRCNISGPDRCTAGRTDNARGRSLKHRRNL